MKNKYIKYFLLIFASMAFFSCSSSDDYVEENIPGNEQSEDDKPITLTVLGQPLPDYLQCEMYIFQKNSTAQDSEYTLKATQTINPNGDNKLEIKNIDLIEKTYRFLFIATSKNLEEVSLTKKDGTALALGLKWSDIMINSNEKLVSANNYQGFVDKTSEEILSTKNINATLTRIVGKLKFDIYKVVKQDDKYVSTGVATPHFNVLDRVYKIEIEYMNLTQGVVYDQNNKLKHQAIWGESHKQEITPILFQGENPWFRNFKIDESQKVDSLTYSKEKAGSAHIAGIYCMPSDKNMKVKLIFHYYDTTPICNDKREHYHASNCYPDINPICGKLPHMHSQSCYTGDELTCGKESHAHRKECYDVPAKCGLEEYIYTVGCFPEESIELNLPKENSATHDPLSIIPNHFTVNTAQIRYNRIIDVGTKTSFEFNTDWENDK